MPTPQEWLWHRHLACGEREYYSAKLNKYVSKIRPSLACVRLGVIILKSFPPARHTNGYNKTRACSKCSSGGTHCRNSCERWLQF
ncbi:hypothetical protein QUB70_19620 [Microcoleus sp. A003_D6]